MRFFRLVIATMLTISAALALSAEEMSLEAIVEQSRGFVERAGEFVDEELQRVFKAPVESEVREWMRARPMAVESIESSDGLDAQSRSWREIEEGALAQLHDETIAPPHPEVPEDVMYVYISLSMPAQTIRSLFLEAIDRKDEITTIFVLRGWDVPGPNALVGRLNRLFPDGDQLGELPNVQINPVLYRQQDIALVPAFTKQDTTGRWGQIIGVTTLDDAAARLDRGTDEGAVIGPSYTIEEPDILELIETRAAGIDWEGEVERVHQGILTRQTTGGALPYATRDDSYLVDLTIVNNADLAGPQGDVFAVEGETVNPLDYLTMSRKYVFIDANSPAQVDQAIAWKMAHERVTVITTVPVANLEQRQRVMAMIGQQVYEINDLLVRRFQLREVPAIAYQDGRMLRVDVVKVLPTQRAAGGIHE